MADKVQEKMKPIALRGHEKPITMIKFNFDGDLFFSSAAEKKINLWAAYSGERIGSYECEGACKCIDVTTDCDFLVAGTLVGNVEFFKVENGKHLGRLAYEAKIFSTEFSYGEKQLLVLLDWYSKDKSGTNSIYLYDFDKIKPQLIQNAKDNSIKLTVEPKQITFKYKFSMAKWGFLNKNIIGATEDGQIQILSLTGEVVRKVDVTKNTLHPVRFIHITKDHSLMLACHEAGVDVYDPKTLDSREISYKTEVPMNAGAISPLLFEKDEKNRKYHCMIGGGVSAKDAARTKMGGFDIRLENLMYGEDLGTIAGHFGPVNYLAFHKDGRGFVSGGEEGIIRIFRFPSKYFTEIDKPDVPTK